MKDLIDIEDLSLDEIDAMIDTARDIMANREKYSERMKGKVLATLFYEPSTRTRLSFSSAMLYLGGGVIGFSDAASSSASKGESLRDTIRIVSGYCDIIALRSPLEGSALAAAEVTELPVINAGDGGHAHPSQTLSDLATIKIETGRLDDLTIGICGDLKYGRTTHSLVSAMSRAKGNRFVFISPEELKMPDYVINRHLKGGKGDYIETTSLKEQLPNLDVLYMTRVQRERFSDIKEYEMLKDSYILTPELLENASENLKILHPLPRVNEIAPEIDSDPRALYIKQAHYGRYMRMALILKLLESRRENKNERHLSANESLKCTNPKCVSNVESTVPALFVEETGKNEPRCAYCECTACRK